MLALFGFIPWRAVPVMPVEIMLLPKWFPFHLDKISYWSRTVIVPLLVLMAKRPVARNAKGVRIDELFLGSPANLGPTPKAPQQKASWFWFFRGVDNVLRVIEPLLLRRLPSHQRAIDRAVAWVGERLNGEDGFGAIFPAMANSVMMFDVLGYPESHPQRAIARKSVEKLLVVHEHEAYCQPCVSPIWDTGLICHALLEAGGERAAAQVKKGLDWLVPKQILDVRGDWIARRPNLRPGGWAFQYANAHYPDVDDTAVVAMAMDRVQKASGRQDFRAALERAREWIIGMQSDNGAWGAFDADNEFYYLNNIPFADHGALLDPPTEDVTARCVSMLAQFGERAETSPVLRARSTILRRTQLADGSWYGRWGMNYIYGTWSVLCCLNAAGLDPAAPIMRKAADWLVSIQNADGGWGEDGTSYKLDYHGYEQRSEHRLADRLGADRPDGGGRGRFPGGQARDRLPPAHARVRRAMGGGALHRDRFSARVLFALPRLRQILSALGAGALPEPDAGPRTSNLACDAAEHPEFRHRPRLRALCASGCAEAPVLRHHPVGRFRQCEPIRHQVWRHLVLRHHVVGKPLPHLVLAEQFNAEIAAQSELLAVRAQRHFGMIDLAVARIEDAAVLVDETLALHALDDDEAERRRILLVARAVGADRIRVFAGLEEHLGDGAFVNTIMLKYEKPAADPAVLVDLRPHAGCGGLGRAQRTAIGKPGHQTGHDERSRIFSFIVQHPSRRRWKHAPYIVSAMCSFHGIK